MLIGERDGSWEPGAGSWEAGLGAGSWGWELGAGSLNLNLKFNLVGTWFELGRTELSAFLDVVGELNECV